MDYVYEYYSLLIPPKFMTNALCAKLETLSIPNHWYIWCYRAAREISRQIVFDREQILHTSSKILNKHRDKR